MGSLFASPVLAWDAGTPTLPKSVCLCACVPVCLCVCDAACINKRRWLLILTSLSPPSQTTSGLPETAQAGGWSFCTHAMFRSFFLVHDRCSQPQKVFSSFKHSSKTKAKGLPVRLHSAMALQGGMGQCALPDSQFKYVVQH
mmetsp:Transcript_49785/g.125164  ORF Transcript_49785/g.125164 Transcript_49785/m.125164 type:complete len:142 (+) Transcript_49785:79-504(+)